MPYKIAVACVLFAAVAVGPPASRPAVPPRSVVEGSVDRDAKRPQQPYVFAFDADTGVPYSNVGDFPTTDGGNDTFAGTYVQAGTDGRFRMPGLFPGRYRFLAQSWDAQTPGQKLEDVRGHDVTVLGVAEDVDVTPAGKPRYLSMGPLGTATLVLTAEHDDTFVLVSTRPLEADPILQYMAWRGEFLQHLVAAVNIAGGRATVRGLPAGRLYLSALRNDDLELPFGTADVTAAAEATTRVAVHVASTYDGVELPVPAELTRKRAAAGRDRRAVAAALRAVLPPRSDIGVRAKLGIGLPLDARIGGTPADPITVADYLTWQAYDAFNGEVRERARAATRPGGR